MVEPRSGTFYMQNMTVITRTVSETRGFFWCDFWCDFGMNVNLGYQIMKRDKVGFLSNKYAPFWVGTFLSTVSDEEISENALKF